MLIWKNECLYLSLMHEKKIGILGAFCSEFFLLKRQPQKVILVILLYDCIDLFRNQKWTNSPQILLPRITYHHRRYHVIDGRHLLQEGGVHHLPSVLGK